MNRNSRPRVHRRSTPQVRDGKVQRKNRQAETCSGPLIRREQPGAGFRHVVRKSDLAKFMDILPEWEELSHGLREIVLAKGDPDAAGWHRPGIVAICAWERCDSQELSKSFVEDHASLYDRLGISYTWTVDDGYENEGYFVATFTDESIRAYQLLHIFLHELGHHHDRMTTKPQIQSSRGEAYAEQYALRNEALLFRRYCEAFSFRVR